MTDAIFGMEPVKPVNIVSVRKQRDGSMLKLCTFPQRSTLGYDASNNPGIDRTDRWLDGFNSATSKPRKPVLRMPMPWWHPDPSRHWPPGGAGNRLMCTHWSPKIGVFCYFWNFNLPKYSARVPGWSLRRDNRETRIYIAVWKPARNRNLQHHLATASHRYVGVFFLSFFRREKENS